MYTNIQWLEIPISDAERAQSFYKKVFKLDFEFIQMGDDKMFMFGESDETGSPGALILSESNKPSKNGVTIYFTCENLEESMRLAKENGAESLVEITDIGEFGRFAQILDTEGNRIGLHSRNR